ncbi:MAG TPA: hypothetical protein VF447_08480 [Terriglobales bacterium]
MPGIDVLSVHAPNLFNYLRRHVLRRDDHRHDVREWGLLTQGGHEGHEIRKSNLRMASGAAKFFVLEGQVVIRKIGVS